LPDRACLFQHYRFCCEIGCQGFDLGFAKGFGNQAHAAVLAGAGFIIGQTFFKIKFGLAGQIGRFGVFA